MALYKMNPLVNENEGIPENVSNTPHHVNFANINFLDSSWYEMRLYTAAIEVIRAQVRMYAKKNLIPESIFNIVASTLNNILNDINNGCVSICDGSSDLYQTIFSLLNRQIPEHMHYLFLAYSPTEHRATALRLWLRDAIDNLEKVLQSTQKILIEKAEQHLKTIIPSYCHGQNAQPTSLGYILMSYVFMLGRDRSRLEELRRRVNRSPAGAYMGVGTSIEINRRALARSLGFDGVVYNAMDALNDYDFAIEFVSFASICVTHINKLTQEIFDWQHPTYGFIFFSEAHLTNDFILGQPRYPIAIEEIKSKSSLISGYLDIILSMNKGRKACDNQDNRILIRPVIETYDALVACLKDISNLIMNFAVNKKRTKEEAQQAQGFAPDIVAWLIKNTNLNYNQAVLITRNIINFATQNGRKLSLLELSELQTIEPQINEGIYSVLISSRAVTSRRSLGGSNYVQVRKSIKLAKKEFLKYSLTHANQGY